MSNDNGKKSAAQSGDIPVVLIFGPTAVGKTALLSAPFFLNTEIVNADSMQVYRGMDIGTAKADADFLKKVTHHLIDIRLPSEQFHAGDFVKLTDTLSSEIYRRGKLPVICGGTGFYFKNFIYGLPEAPESDEKIRESLQAELREQGSSELFSRLGKIDPVTAERISKNDTYRILRALEVYYSSGRPLSDYKLPDTPRAGYKFLLIGLTRPREELYSRINERVELMFKEGLENEVIKLISEGYNENDPGMKGIGYREFFSKDKEDLSNEALMTLIKKNSRHYAKRQITWFRQLDDINWFSPDDIDGITECARTFSEPFFEWN
ncbi:MAG: tRNA (adenosine(37)-N6)-dimethylallyltransferase MiaA [Spirochaetales bacterium]|nr:tRNA (adenosine(37)-N6)-dimethylallyltransferase MiaA [Spirochaetales bacterium]